MPILGRWTLIVTGPVFREQVRERASGATGYARWKTQRPVAFLNRKKSKHLDKKRLLELWLSNHVTPTFDAGPLSSEVRVPWGPPIKYDPHNFLLA
jgi:hypothetical protein